MTTERNALEFPYLQGNVDLADVDLESAPPFQLYGNIVAGPPEGAAARLCGYFERACDAPPSSTALECDGESFSYADLDRRANRLANYLLGRGVGTGVRVGILLNRSVNTYVALLAVTKTEATFVPIDPASPADRLAFVAEDAGLDLLVTTTSFAAVTAALPCQVLAVDELAAELAVQPSTRPGIESAVDPVCYIIYTSGSSGRPKGVQIAQSSICNFIGIVPALYGVRSTDRVYQGMTIAFDFSIEEIWPTWAVGATLVAGPTDGRRVGAGLADFLEEQRITMIYCVPTVLATLDRTLPLIHTVNVGGEACPRELVDRWGPGRRILNTYGPTETTVTCTMAELEPGKPVTIGHPLPSYRVTLLDEDRRPVPHGEIGEICVGGPGVGRGYVNRPELTADRFLQDPQGRPGDRIYRTGDLGRVLPDGEIEYLGRADSEVKVRGHRVDLQEIENVFLEPPRIAVAVVALLESSGTGGDLAGYVVLRDGQPAEELVDLVVEELHERLVRRLPPYMVPTYLDGVDAVPMLPSGKADRASLPAPSRPRLVRGIDGHVPPATPTETWVAGVWEEALRLPAGAVSVEADFFDGFGGHSLLAATIVSRMRDAELGSGLSVGDFYRHPTVRSLSEFLEAAESPEAGPQAGTLSRPDRPSRRRVAAVGATQLFSLYGVVLLFLLPVAVLYSLHGGRPSAALVVQLAIALPVFYLVVRWGLPIVGTRLLSRGLQPGDHALWSPTHLRVWTIQKLMTISPLNVLTGSPWAATYLRLAGARVEQECHIGTADIGLPSLLRIDHGATVGYGTQLHPYRVTDGRLSVGPVAIGAGGGAASPGGPGQGSEVSEGAILREQSLLESGQTIPVGQTWAGSPARPSPEVDEVLELMASCAEAPRTWSRRLLTGFAGGILLLEILPFLIMAPVVALVWVMLLASGTVAGLVAAALSGPLFVATSCALILGVRRLVLPATTPGVHHLRSQLGL